MVYLAIIAALIIVIAYAAARAVSARRSLAALEDRFGLAEGGASASAPRKGGQPLRQLEAAALLRPRTYDQYRREVGALVERAAALEEFGPRSRLSEACGKALRGGRHLRAVMLLEIARATSEHAAAARTAAAQAAPSPVDAGEAALFVEYLHAASLVIDDLPEFDNAAERRGRPALHAEEGPAVAQMAAMSLVAAAFQNMCRQLDWIRDNCPEAKNVDRIGTRVCDLVSRALGAFGAAGGQLLEMSPGDWPAGEAPPGQEIALRKTASLFELAVATGWLVAGGDPAKLGEVRAAGKKIGAAYQIADDLSDAAGDAARATAGRPDTNYANLYGRDVAEADLDRHLRGARLLLERRGLWTPLWEDELFPMIRAPAAGGDPAAGEAPPA